VVAVSESGVGNDGNLAPWGNRRRMRILAAVSVLAGLILCVAGLVAVGQHHKGAWTIFGIGAAGLVLMAVVVPYAHRQGKA
jgi:peptidoglycan/LPS O-acetylase OafA/YrhL